MIPLLVSSGEPAGVGPDVCLALADYEYPVVIMGDVEVLHARAMQLKQNVRFVSYSPEEEIVTQSGSLSVMHVPCAAPVVAGQLDPKNSPYVLELLNHGATLCQKQQFSAFVTAPVHKAIINDAGFKFSGHTEFLEHFYKVPQVVMMLACEQMRVALVTTHLPLKQVPEAITLTLINDVIRILNNSLTQDFGITNPKIKVAGLNPHAGESGYLGREEIEVISPAIQHLKHQGIDVQGPIPADTLFITNESNYCDAFVCMYHDQGLPVLKYAGFENAVNITLGLPIIRTSVDHGTALELAGTGKAHPGSLIAAVETAQLMAKHRMNHAES